MIEIPYTADHSANRARVDTSRYLPCIVCGRAIKAAPALVRVYWGSHIVTAEEAERLHIAEGGDGGDLYYYPIGPDCLRRHPAIKPYVRQSEAFGHEEEPTKEAQN